MQRFFKYFRRKNYGALWPNLLNRFHLGCDFCERIKIFSSDMWEGYINMAKELFPNARIVVDRFHFFAHLQKALDSSRKALHRLFPEEESLKNIKWLFLKNGINLSIKEQEKLNTLLDNPSYVW